MIQHPINGCTSSLASRDVQLLERHVSTVKHLKEVVGGRGRRLDAYGLVLTFVITTTSEHGHLGGVTNVQRRCGKQQTAGLKQSTCLGSAYILHTNNIAPRTIPICKHPHLQTCRRCNLPDDDESESTRETRPHLTRAAKRGHARRRAAKLGHAARKRTVRVGRGVDSRASIRRRSAHTPAHPHHHGVHPAVAAAVVVHGHELHRSACLRAPHNQRAPHHHCGGGKHARGPWQRHPQQPLVRV